MVHLIFSNAALACSQFLFAPEDTVVLMRGVADLGNLPCKVVRLGQGAAPEDDAKLLMDLIESSEAVKSCF